MTIRAATLDDVPRLHELAAHFLCSTPYGDLLRAPSEARLFSLIEQVLTLGIILVAEVDAAIEGMIALVALEHPFSGEPFGDELVWWVEPGHRGSSIGPRLLDLAEAWAMSKGLVMLKMVAPAGSDIHEFYTRMGYVPVETAYSKQLSTSVTFRRSMQTMPTEPKNPTTGDRGPQPATPKTPSGPQQPTPRTPGAPPPSRMDDDDTFGG